MSDNQPIKGGTVVSFPHGQPIPKVLTHHTVSRPTIFDVWRDKSKRGYMTRCHLRGSLACLVMSLCFLLTKFLPSTQLLGNLVFVFSITILAVWLGCEVWGAAKTRFVTPEKK